MALLDKEKDARLIDRLANHKFTQAWGYLNEEHPYVVRHTVTLLHELFGNVGWTEGKLAELAGVLVEYLIGKEDACPSCVDDWCPDPWHEGQPVP